MSENDAVQKGYLPANGTGKMIMAMNLRLTHAVKERVVQSFQPVGSELLIGFVDGSTLTVTIAECNSLPLHGVPEPKIFVFSGRTRVAKRIV
jgi:hypothetical protein